MLKYLVGVGKQGDDYFPPKMETENRGENYAKKSSLSSRLWKVISCSSLHLPVCLHFSSDFTPESGNRCVSREAGGIWGVERQLRAPHAV